MQSKGPYKTEDARQQWIQKLTKAMGRVVMRIYNGNLRIAFHRALCNVQGQNPWSENQGSETA